MLKGQKRSNPLQACKRGHPYTSETPVYRGARRCRECHAEGERLRRAKSKAGLSPKTWLERVLERVEKTDTCWLWSGKLSAEGYGRLGHGRKFHPVHRWIYEQLVAPVPKHLHMDHLCRVRHCVNPEHMEPVTPGENVRRGVSPIAKNSNKTHCPNGHQLTKVAWANRRQCVTCQRRFGEAANEKLRQRKKAEGTYRKKLGGETHCLRGHEYTEENTYRSKAGFRSCLRCKREYYWRKKAEASASP